MKRELIINKSGEIEVLPNPIELKFNATGVIQLFEKDGFLYKLHKMPNVGFNDEKHKIIDGPDRFIWIAMWNCLVHIGDYHKSFIDAINFAIKKGGKVYQMNQGDLIKL